MYLDLKPDGSITLNEAEDFSRFEIRSSIELAPGNLSENFFSIAEPTNNGRYWVNADAVMQLSSKSNDPEWCTAFWTMLEKAEPYGSADVAQKRIKAQVRK